MSDPNSLQADHAESPDDFHAMLTGAALVFIVGVIPVVYMVGCCLIPQILGALLAVHVYTKKYQLTVSAGKGIVLGILTCLLGGVAAFVVVMVLQKFGLDPTQAMTQEWSIQFAERIGGPEAAEEARRQIELQNSQGVGALQIVIGLVIGIILNAIGGLVGGAIGAAVFKRAPKEAPVA